MTNLSPVIVLLFCMAQTLSLPCHRIDKDRKVALTTCRVLQFPHIESAVTVEDIRNLTIIRKYSDITFTDSKLCKTCCII